MAMNLGKLGLKLGETKKEVIETSFIIDKIPSVIKCVTPYIHKEG